MIREKRIGMPHVVVFILTLSLADPNALRSIIGLFKFVFFNDLVNSKPFSPGIIISTINKSNSRLSNFSLATLAFLAIVTLKSLLFK